MQIQRRIGQRLDQGQVCEDLQTAPDINRCLGARRRGARHGQRQKFRQHNRKLPVSSHVRSHFFPPHDINL
jgi:hypothetical protein